jgi:hypothetical protein
LCKTSPSKEERAQGMPGVLLHPQPCVGKVKHTSIVTADEAETSTFPAQWC